MGEELTIEEKAYLFIREIKSALKNGTLHYRVSDGALLQTPEEIITALLQEGQITFKPVRMMGTCKKPDRDFPELMCGHPLPCPWHTITVDTISNPPAITIPAIIGKELNATLRRLKEIANILRNNA